MDWLVKSMFPGARLLTRHDAPGVLACVENIARKAGCTAPPVYYTPSQTINAAIYPAGQSMVIFQGILDATGNNLKDVPNEKLEGILAHEMGHWKSGWRHFGPMLAIIGGSALIASAAVYLYDRAHKKQKQAQEEGDNLSLEKAFSETFEDMKQKSFWKNFKEYYAYNATPHFSIVGAADTQPGSWGEYMKRQVAMIAAQAASLAVALPACRPFALRNEFEADAFAARITGKPEVYIKTLEDLHREIQEAVAYTAKRVSNPKAQETVGKAARKWFNGVLQETVMAHPSWESRVAAIRKIAPTITTHLPH